MAIALAMLLMLGFRALVFSVHYITGDGLTPCYQEGDQILVNRCSYGLRIEGNGLLPYSRLLRQPVQRGDIVLFNMPNTSPSVLMIARCKAIPGDTLQTNKGTLVIPGLKTCADADYYWMEAINPQNPIDSRHLGFISEQQIIGKVTSVLFNRKDLYLP